MRRRKCWQPNCRDPVIGRFWIWQRPSGGPEARVQKWCCAHHAEMETQRQRLRYRKLITVVAGDPGDLPRERNVSLIGHDWPPVADVPEVVRRRIRRTGCCCRHGEEQFTIRVQRHDELGLPYGAYDSVICRRTGEICPRSLLGYLIELYGLINGGGADAGRDTIAAEPRARRRTRRTRAAC